MTEAEWLASEYPTGMGDHLGSSASQRKLRLYHCACARRAWKHLDERGRHAVEVAERVCDGQASLAELLAAHDQAHDAFREVRTVVDWFLPIFVRSVRSRFWAAQTAVGASAERLSVWGVSWTGEKTVEAQANWWDAEFTGRSRVEERKAQARLLRDIIGNPFRPARVEETWRTPAVIELARAAYQTRDFSALLALADALEEAGCDEADLLDHCRQAGEHVRGCWVVDLVLNQR